MVDVVYRIVEHDGGWAYKLGDVFSETFPSRTAAEAAATIVAAEQRVPDDDVLVSWQDEDGLWHDETESGSNRPDTSVAADERDDGVAVDDEDSIHDRGLVDHAVHAYDRGDQYVRRGAGLTSANVRKYPIASVLLVGACGYLLGSVLHGRR